MKDDTQYTLFLVAMKAVFFCLGVSFFLGMVVFYKDFHENTKDVVRNNDTILVNDTMTENMDLDISEVIYEILDVDDTVIVSLNGTQITPYMREQIKSNKTALNLYLSATGAFHREYTYDTSGNLYKVEFILNH